MSMLLDPPGAAPQLATTPVAFRRRSALTAPQIAEADAMLAGATPQEIVRWAVDMFGSRLVLTASFQDTTLIDIATSVDPDVEVVFLDTGFHFSETLNVVKRAMDRYALNVTVLRPDPDAADLWAAGTKACCDLWAAGTKACCDARKVVPLERYLVGHADAWLSGLRRADDPARADAPIVSLDKRGLVKVNPMAAMSDDEYSQYIADHDVLINTLHLDGYASIGCWPCTDPSSDGRAGRWAGRDSKECGLHL
jgi:phosphoadenosine phosphosulfate reductase